ncbi:THO complex subunit 3 [Turnera subulata]|uniref:THO complex subunit 3 n=1 Tax=Turnera subulata TaxID=218843 RepID=A0A9Q0IYK7_9ROSI|nr:THO complex subunit 3 [Turnera subulata]
MVLTVVTVTTTTTAATMKTTIPNADVANNDYDNGYIATEAKLATINGVSSEEIPNPAAAGSRQQSRTFRARVTEEEEVMEEIIPFKNLHTREYQGHKKKVHSVAWNCTGTKLASGSVDQTARLWHIEPHGHGKIKDVELKGHTDSVDQLCWDPKHADLIATASGDKTVRLWDARSGKCSQQTELTGENINITYRPDGTHIAVGNRDDELTILDVRKFKPIHRRKFNYEADPSPCVTEAFSITGTSVFLVNEIAWNMTGEMFLLTTGNGTVEVLAYPSLQPLDTLMAHTAGCYCIAIDPKGRYFAVGSADSLVSLWDISQMLCVRTFTKLEWPVRTVSFNHTGDYIASASEDLFIDIANVQTGRSVHQIPCRAAMNSVEWNPKYNLLAFAGDDKNKYQADEGVFRIYGFETA